MPGCSEAFITERRALEGICLGEPWPSTLRNMHIENMVTAATSRQIAGMTIGAQAGFWDGLRSTPDVRSVCSVIFEFS